MTKYKFKYPATSFTTLNYILIIFKLTKKREKIKDMINIQLAIFKFKWSNNNITYYISPTYRSFIQDYINNPIYLIEEHKYILNKTKEKND